MWVVIHLGAVVRLFSLSLLVALGAVLLAAVCPPPAGAAAKRYRVGMGDQDPSMFANASFRALGIKRVRYIVPWDSALDPDQAEIDRVYMEAARAEPREVLVAFGARRGCFDGGIYAKSDPGCVAPTAAQFKQAFLAFRALYPDVTTYSPWNEANHLSQPTAKKPKLAARYFDIVAANCRRCKIVALDVLDSSNMVTYVKAFRRAAEKRPTIWGIHNYADVNRRRVRQTKALLKTVRGEVWMTETGGIVAFGESFPYDEKRAAARTKDLFRLADRFSRKQKGLKSRIMRIYPYQWTGVEPGARFDAGLVNPDGSPRAAFDVFLRLARTRGR